MENENTHWSDVIWWCQIGLVAGFVSLLCSGCDPCGDKKNPLPAYTQVFSVGPELSYEAYMSADLWNEATGKSITISENGIPINLMDHVYTDKGEERCGITNISYVKGPIPYQTIDSINIARATPGCSTWLHTLMHEMGHAISETPYGKPVHSIGGLMDAEANDIEYIDDVSLNLICLYSACNQARMTPPGQ